MTLYLLPDTERLVRSYLVQVSELTTLVGTNISTEQPGNVASAWITFARFGGPALGSLPEAMDVARFQFDAWATDKATANTIARTLRAALRASTNYRLATVGTLGGCSIVTDLAWQPDTSRTPPTPRYVLTVDVYARP
jgi:hypothetical protein